MTRLSEQEIRLMSIAHAITEKHGSRLRLEDKIRMRTDIFRAILAELDRESGT